MNLIILHSMREFMMILFDLQANEIAGIFFLQSRHIQVVASVADLVAIGKPGEYGEC